MEIVIETFKRHKKLSHQQQKFTIDFSETERPTQEQKFFQG